ncbi:MAG: hypothetical protein F6K40_22610 [Okeania sp. SIO3I5]|uniref:hypothetical protein n=1 Tax=Okeania sp. SIO3I5 TaxID=2607805 RepID=UPI0013B68499|nr:hypothetical protein [Okeania sp. SIO3I5]NEQ38912.1 hypothetical protein [Okeania sp. SIO3I5]
MKNTKIEARKISLESVVKNILTVRKISASDRKTLRLALFSFRSLTVTEKEQIKEVYEELKAGRLSLMK